jgi:hypothetical protein
MAMAKRMGWILLGVLIGITTLAQAPTGTCYNR